jgi:hypothetical protein|tara:strand:+ start:6333 stop:7010 length:678 start_codon:yes stop_codon:yes gene_type:complete
MNWPLIVADDFYRDIDLLKQFCEKQNYAAGLNFPGFRTDPVHEINNNLFQEIALKTLAVLYPDNYRNLSFEATSYIQRVPPNLVDGWVHSDSDSQITSILYLNKNINAGTSLFRPVVPSPDINSFSFDKRSYYQRVNNLDKLTKKEDEIFTKIRTENNDQFRKTCFINSEYNRCIMFDAVEYHAAENFYSDTNEDRYTYITFWHQLWDKGKQLNPHLTTSRRVIP